jgi:hypothetical protein
MRGAERPANVCWTRPFLKPLPPLTQSAARQTFPDITDTVSDTAEIDRLLCLADNTPLAIDLIAHLVDCAVLELWEKDKTYILSEGHDRKSNVDLSISLSLSGARMASSPHAQDLLSLLSMLPDGLSDVELLQRKLPLDNIRTCKSLLLCTSLAYNDDKGCLRMLVPIREYMLCRQPPKDHLIISLRKHFQHILALHSQYLGTISHRRSVPRIASNFRNI